jgi:hypothetical protein
MRKKLSVPVLQGEKELCKQIGRREGDTKKRIMGTKDFSIRQNDSVPM